MKIIFAADHAGYNLKESLKKYFAKKYDIVDVGAYTRSPQDDYPRIAQRGVASVKKYKTKGIFICGSGVGMNIAANRHSGIRAVTAESTTSAIRSRKEEDANILVLGARVVSEKKALHIARQWLKTRFTGLARHKRRVRQLDQKKKWQLS